MICLAGLPWSFFMVRLLTPFKELDIWHANTWWMQGWILLLAGIHSLNQRPLAQLPQVCWWMMIWPTLATLWIFTTQLKSGEPYPSGLLLGLANLWSVMLALLLMAAWTKAELTTISTAIFWSGVGLILYGYLQVLNLDQFFKWIDTSKTTDTLVGTIGNMTHFGCQLALWLPFALIQPKLARWWVLPALILMVLAHSSTALAAVALLLAGWGWSAYPRLKYWVAGTLGMVGIGFLLTNPEWLSFHGRLETWTEWTAAITQRPIIGWGLGFVKHLAQTLPTTSSLFAWKHLHNEFFQWWVETGIIGVGIGGWMLCNLWQRRRATIASPLKWACGWSFTLCCLMALLNFPFHLWQLGGWGLAALAGWLVCTQQEMA